MNTGKTSSHQKDEIYSRITNTAQNLFIVPIDKALNQINTGKTSSHQKDEIITLELQILHKIFLLSLLIRLSTKLTPEKLHRIKKMK